MTQVLASWIENERGRFILFLPVAMAAAILIYFNLPAEPPLWLGFVSAGLALLLLILFWRLPIIRFVVAMILAGSLGFARAEWRTVEQPPLMEVPYGALTLSGRIASIDLLPKGRRITLCAGQIAGAAPLVRTVRIRLRNDDDTALSVGDSVVFRVLLFRQDRPAYPGGWDFGRDAFFQDLGASGFALDDVEVVGQVPRNDIRHYILNLRGKIADQIMATLPLRTGAVAATLLTGFQQIMPANERQAFVSAGLAHILAVAGLHVGIVMGLFFAITRFICSRFELASLHINGKAVGSITAFAGGIMYAALTGTHLPILRSLAMASLVTLGVLAGRRAFSLRGLALAALILMMATPEVVIGVSFQMSFSAVLALIAGYAAMKNNFANLYQKHSVFGKLATNIFALGYTSLLAGGASMPFAAYQFQQVQPYWILANLIAVPLTAAWVMPFGLLSLALMPVGLASFALIPMGWGISIIVWMTAEISRWPDAMLGITPVPGSAILLFSFGLAWLCLWRSWPRLGGIAFMLIGLIVYASARPPDVLVSPDARMIAVRMDAQVLFHRQSRTSLYVINQWQSVWGHLPIVALDNSPLPAGVICQTKNCIFYTRNGPIMLALAPPYTDCKIAILVISPEPLRGACDGYGRLVIDRFSVWRDGAIAIWIGPRGVSILTDRQAQGNRPWVPNWPTWEHQ
jgi:competence protein ComEC